MILFPLLLMFQADILSELNTRVVVPLIPVDQVKKEATERLKPIIMIDSQPYILMTTDIVALRLEDLMEFKINIE